MPKRIDAVCTMATRECADELALFHRALRTFHPTLPLFLGCTSEMQDERLPALSPSLRAVHRDPHVRWVPCLDAYGPAIARKTMERQPGLWYATRHTDFMMEKANLMELAMRSVPAAAAAASSSGAPLVAFLDCDITLLRQLPTLPATATVALSPHEMQRADEALFGRYNGGYVVTSSPEALWQWRRATASSRYFDQASLEHVADVFAQRAELHCLPPQHNYGFWRLLQPQRGTAFDEAKRFSIAPLEAEGSKAAILYDGSPLCSVHTHFYLYTAGAPRDVRLFNDLVLRWIGAARTQNSTYAAAFAPMLSKATIQ